MIPLRGCSVVPSQPLCAPYHVLRNEGNCQPRMVLTTER